VVATVPVPAVGLAARGGDYCVRVVPSLDEVAAALGSARLAAAAIDITIGLPSCGPRACDKEARRLLGPRRSSVFPAPARSVLAARTYAEACTLSRSACGRAVSRQLFNILPKVREVDALASPALQDRLFEMCPELSLAMASGRPMAHNKRTPPGRAERLAVLHRAFPMAGSLLEAAPPKGAHADDVLDAFAGAWTARRIAAGESLRLGGDVDDRGLRMEVLA
jgi:predicted RNase H-like nuclease